MWSVLHSLMQIQYSDQCPSSPTFSYAVSRSTLLLALSSLPKQQKNLTKPLLLRGLRPSSKASFVDSFEMEDVGLRGMVALAKMSEDALRCLFGVCCDVLQIVSEEEDGVNAPCVEF